MCGCPISPNAAISQLYHSKYKLLYDDMMFLIYIDDIADNLESFTRLFPDDTSLLYSSDSLKRQLRTHIDVTHDNIQLLTLI